MSLNFGVRRFLITVSNGSQRQLACSNFKQLSRCGLIDAYVVTGELPEVERQVTVSPTGSGKTFMMAAIIEVGLNLKEFPIFVWLTHNKQILTQTEEEIIPYLKNIVTVRDIEQDIDRFSSRILLLNVQKGVSPKAKTWLKKWLNYKKNDNKPIIFIVDEADEGMSSSNMKSLRGILKPCLELGFTASFKKKPFESVFYTVPLKDVIEAGILAYEIYYFASDQVNRSEMFTLAIEQRDLLEEIANLLKHTEPDRFFIPKMLIQTSARYCIDVGLELQKVLRLSNQQLNEQVIIHTQDSRGMDEVEDLKLVKYIIGDMMIERGWNCPEVYVLLSLKQNVSKVKGKQLLGRVIRLPKGKRFNEAYDDLNKGYVYISGKHSIEESCKVFGHDMPIVAPPQKVIHVEKNVGIDVPPMKTHIDELAYDVDSEHLEKINDTICNVIDQISSKCSTNSPEIRVGKLNLLDSYISMNQNKAVETEWDIEHAKSMLIDALATHFPRNYSSFIISEYQSRLSQRNMVGLIKIAPAVKEICNDIKNNRIIRDIAHRVEYTIREYEWPAHKLVIASPRPVQFSHALYPKMQLNSEEEKLALLLNQICSKKNLHWVRNDPSNVRIFKGHAPDFIVFSKDRYIFVEFKGKHLLSYVDTLRKNYKGQIAHPYYLVYRQEDTDRFMIKGLDGEVDQPFTELVITSNLS